MKSWYFDRDAAKVTLNLSRAIFRSLDYANYGSLESSDRDRDQLNEHVYLRTCQTGADKVPCVPLSRSRCSLPRLRLRTWKRQSLDGGGGFGKLGRSFQQ